jgi:site-specific DNA-methyltransferase (adenine-specific)
MLMLDDLSAQSLTSRRPAKAVEASALNMKASVEDFSRCTGLTLGAIVFSPPYANSFDYFESYKLELIAGDFIGDTTIKGGRSRMIRNYRIGYGRELRSENLLVELLCQEIWASIPEKESETGVKDGRTRLIPNMLRAYFEDMQEVLKQGLYSLKSGGRMHIVIDQSAYVGVPIPTDLLFCDIAMQLGFKVESTIVCRRANTSGQQLKRHPILKSLLRESIVTVQKP